jgi:hypothetical protein
VLVSRWSQPQTLKWGLVASTTISQWSCVSTQTIYSQTRIMMSPLGPWNNFFIRQVTFKYMWQLKRGDRMAGLTVWSKEVIAWQVWLYDQKRWSHGRFDCMIKRGDGMAGLTMIKRGDGMAGLTVWSKEVITWQVWLYDQKRWSHGRFDYDQKRW